MLGVHRRVSAPTARSRRFVGVRNNPRGANVLLCTHSLARGDPDQRGFPEPRNGTLEERLFPTSNKSLGDGAPAYRPKRKGNIPLDLLQPRKVFDPRTSLKEMASQLLSHVSSSVLGSCRWVSSFIPQMFGWDLDPGYWVGSLKELKTRHS